MKDWQDHKGCKMKEFDDYIKEVLKTESNDFNMVNFKTNSRLLHASMGLVTESGEFQDTLKKFLFYDKEMDVTNLKEELGDIMWYFAIACDSLGIDFEDILESNINKLRSRYNSGFTQGEAINRNIKEERKILENEDKEFRL